jgi:hypothetical protein
MNLWFGERRKANALQKALERHQALLDRGTDPVEARAAAFSGLDPQVARLFGLAVGLGEASAAAPEPAFAAAFAKRLATVELLPVRAEPARRRLRRPMARPLPGFGFAAAAAAIAIFAGICVPAFRSLPGDPLYAIKRASESARVGVVSGPREARLRLALASRRFGEVEALVERAQTRELSPGVGAAPAAQDIKDPRLAELIRSTLQDAQEQIAVAAQILIAEPPSTEVVEALDQLVAIASHGRQIAEAVVEDLPEPKQPPVLKTVVTLAKIEAEAKAARMQTEPEPLKPCDTPEPTPSASPTAKPEQAGASPTPFVSPSPSPTPRPTSTPEPTPCISPSPTPTPSPTVAPTPEASPSPTPTPEPEEKRKQPDNQRQASETEPDPSGSPGEARPSSA